MEDFLIYNMEEGRLEENTALLQGFQKLLASKGLKAKTMNQHVENIKFFAQDYLFNYNSKALIDLTAEDIRDYLGTWYIRKWAGVSKTNITQNLVAFKKFAKYLHDTKKISEDDYQDILDLCKDKAYFLKRFDAYNSLPSESSEFGVAFEQWMLEEEEFSEGFVDDFDSEALHESIDNLFKKYGRKMP